MRQGFTHPFTLSLWALCAGALGLSFVLPTTDSPWVSICWFYNLSNIPCPGCGLTRAFLFISHGEWVKAWNWNPFGFAWYSLALYGFLRPLLIKYLPRLSLPLDKTLQGAVFIPGLVILMVLAWAFRIGTCLLTAG
jgi:hypothetical protein